LAENKLEEPDAAENRLVVAGPVVSAFFSSAAGLSPAKALYFGALGSSVVGFGANPPKFKEVVLFVWEAARLPKLNPSDAFFSSSGFVWAVGAENSDEVVEAAGFADSPPKPPKFNPAEAGYEASVDVGLGANKFEVEAGWAVVDAEVLAPGALNKDDAAGFALSLPVAVSGFCANKLEVVLVVVWGAEKPNVVAAFVG
jgi:hypothetical protein